MNIKIQKIKCEEKENWIGTKPVQRQNLFLAQDWNKFSKVKQCEEQIENLSSVLTTIFNSSIQIESTLVLETKQTYPTSSILSTINGYVNEYMSGISTIKINDDILTGNINAWYLSAGTTLVNTLNGKTGEVNSVLTALKINDLISSDISVNMGSYFLEYDTYLSAINNNLTGNQWVISSLVIEQREFNTVNQEHFLVLNGFDSSFLKKKETLNYSYITDSNDNNSIVNLQFFNSKISKISAAIEADRPLTLNNVIDWISITNQNYDVIKPTTAILDETGTLTITSPSAGIIKDMSLIHLGILNEYSILQTEQRQIKFYL